MINAFADTFYFIALANPFDTFHNLVQDFSKKNDTLLFTTDEVLIELLTYFSSAKEFTKRKAIKIVDFILDTKDIYIFPQSRTSFLGGLHLYKNRIDKGYSLTDCISMVRMKENNLVNVLTKDKHFRQEGFNILF